MSLTFWVSSHFLSKMGTCNTFTGGKMLKRLLCKYEIHVSEIGTCRADIPFLSQITSCKMLCHIAYSAR